ncbi:protein FAM90A27P [Tupaia chinensis]|uniref:protein FAM90A27P n=1 Tax=Tupaia chinensis TaxID=246437 RepID=UPI0003C8F056|nr:protein FAM90A27P [Tupaia chinensis]
MDPNMISMEEGKQILRRCGIPQRDIDMMTEKWVVVASVEVMLRFPLRPGEDPTARCVSTEKLRPSAGRPCGIPQRPGNQDGRKSNSQSMNGTEQKHRDMKPVASHYLHHQPPRPADIRTLKERQQGPVRQRAPHPEEEDAKVKCRNCGAFGHTARSRRCPIKCSGRALSLQPLGSNKQKENLRPGKPLQVQTAGPFNDMDRERRQRQRREERQSAASLPTLPRKPREKLQNNWEEPAEPCAYLRNPTRPLPVHTTKRRATGPVPTPDVRVFGPTRSPKEASEQGPAKGREVDVSHAPHPARKNWLQSPSPSASPAGSGPGVFCPQAQVKRPDVEAKPRPKCGQDFTHTVQAPGQKPAQGPIQTCWTTPKKARFSCFLTPLLYAQSLDRGAVQACKPLPSTSGLGPRQAPTVTTKTPALKATATLQPTPKPPYLSPVQAFSLPHPPPSGLIPGKLDTIALKNWDEGWQSAGTRRANTPNPPMKSALGDQSPDVIKMYEGQGTCVPGHVLYEDLLVSSSSEYSDFE